MTIAPENMRGSFANAYFDGTDIGAVRNIKPTFTPAGIQIKAGQTGDIEWDEVDKGMTVTVSLELEEISFDSFALAIPGSSVVGDTLLIAANIGASRRANAKALVIKPIIAGVESTDDQEWFTFPLAAIAAGQAATLTYNDGNQQIISAQFKVFPAVQADGSFLFGYKGPAPA